MELYGKGPTSAKSHLIDDVLVCVLRGGLTTLEHGLIDGGQSSMVHDLRDAMPESMRQRFSDVVAEALGREVLAFLTQMHIDPPLVIDVFVLKPERAVA